MPDILIDNILCVTLTLPYYVRIFQSADLNGDGFADIVWCAAGSSGPIGGSLATTLFVALGTGSGAPGAAQAFSFAGSPNSPGGIVNAGLSEVADIDGDGFDDVLLFATNGNQWLPTEHLYVLYGHPQTILEPAVDMMPQGGGFHLFIDLHSGDVDGDGNLDFLFSRTEYGQYLGRATLLRGLGGRNVASNFIDYGPVPSVLWLAPADYDSDGDTDVIATPTGSGSVHQYYFLNSRGLLGPGCAGSLGMVPALTIGDAQLGGSFNVAVSGASPLAPSALGVSLVPTLTPSQCQLALDLGQLLLPTPSGLGAAMTDAQGGASLSFALPLDPTLQGFPLFCQWAVLDPAGGFPTSAGMLSLSPGRTVVLF